MLELKFGYQDCIQRSERVQWVLDDVMPEGQRLDFDRPFLPPPLIRHVMGLELAPDVQRLLNQIAGNAYLNLFQFVEEYILTTMMKHAQAEPFGDPHAMRALTRMVDEELKHQLLFKRFREAFDRDFAHPCGVLDNAAEVAHAIMSHSPVAVMLITLHIEWMTQAHYTDSVRDDTQIDPFFRRLLHHHWLEESQHAQLDMLELNKLAVQCSPEMLDVSVDEYLGIVDAFDTLLAHQTELDLVSLAQALARPIDEDRLRPAILQSYRRTFIWYGMTHRRAVQCLRAVSETGAAKVAARAEAFA